MEWKGRETEKEREAGERARGREREMKVFFSGKAQGRQKNLLLVLDNT